MATPESPDDFSDSDRAWIDALQGKGGDAPPDAVLLQRVLEREQAAAPALPPNPQQDAQRLQQLMFELRRQRLLERPSSQRWAWPVGLAAAAVLVAGVTFNLVQPPAAVYDEAPSWRGGEAPRVRQQANPRQAAEALMARLRAQGASVLIYQDGRAFVLDIEVAPAALDRVRPLLLAEQLPATAGLHRLRIEP